MGLQIIKHQMIQVYDYVFENGNYHFVTDSYCVYEIRFSFSDRFFDKHCSSCKDIFEVNIVCLSHDCPRNDKRTGATICNIFEVFLSDSCNGIMYWCRDDDEKGYKREMKFDRWFDFFCTSDKIERFAQEFCDEECLKYYLLVDKGCTNYPIVVHDFNHRCRNCSGDPYPADC